MIIVLCDNGKTAVTTNFKTAYKVGLTLGQIAKPQLTYRQALAKWKEAGIIHIIGESEIACPVAIIRSKLIKNA